MPQDSDYVDKLKNSCCEENLNRLSKPKNIDHRYLPNRPSIYWLDYLLDRETLKIRDPVELQNYYDKYLTPRLRQLSQPKIKETFDGNQNGLFSPNSSIKSFTGIKYSALKYVPSARLIALAEPKSSIDEPTLSKLIRLSKSCSSTYPINECYKIQSLQRSRSCSKK